MEIKRYEEKYKDDVRFVCLNSNGPCKLNEKQQHLILTTYCDYFIEQEGNNCFVAVNKDDKAVGYILCAENYDKYKKIFRKEYLTRFRKIEISSRITAGVSSFFQAMYKKNYPAHMHIDILPEYQRLGLGHKLVDALCENLRAKGVKGVCLTMWSGNEKGGSFYKKYGFTLLSKWLITDVFALKF
ncbi:MAG: GNAT family N-acetyltransferase [Clostridia bacterium]|nr:GNAT family N-acetyltransferase [Clostridia bacterium]